MTDLEQLLARKAEMMREAAALQLGIDLLARDAGALGQMLRQFRLDHDLLPPREARYAPDAEHQEGRRDAPPIPFGAARPPAQPIPFSLGRTARHDGTD